VDSGEESSDGGADDESDERKPEAMATQTKIIVLSDSDSEDKEPPNAKSKRRTLVILA
jgi:hypothetical protein